MRWKMKQVTSLNNHINSFCVDQDIAQAVLDPLLMCTHNAQFDPLLWLDCGKVYASINLQVDLNHPKGRRRNEDCFLCEHAQVNMQSRRMEWRGKMRKLKQGTHRDNQIGNDFNRIF